MKKVYSISGAIEILRKNLSDIGRVNEWANYLGYKNPKKFSRFFLKRYKMRPQKAINYVRLKSIIKKLRSNNHLTNREIAQLHSLPDEKALNKFTNYHTKNSPSKIRAMSKDSIKELMENLDSEYFQEYD